MDDGIVTYPMDTPTKFKGDNKYLLTSSPKSVAGFMEDFTTINKSSVLFI